MTADEINLRDRPWELSEGDFLAAYNRVAEQRDPTLAKLNAELEDLERSIEPILAMDREIDAKLSADPTMRDPRPTHAPLTRVAHAQEQIVSLRGLLKVIEDAMQTADHEEFPEATRRFLAIQQREAAAQLTRIEQAQASWVAPERGAPDP